MDPEKLKKVGERCIHDEPPACSASCPIHMDIIPFITEMQKGDFKKAYKVMEKRVPFPRILANICDHPCESVCVRQSAGGANKICELEKAAIKYGYASPKKGFAVPKTAGNVAVIGGGISGLVAAVELDKKGYKVTIFEKSGRLGGRIWDYEGKSLTKDVIEDELKVISDLGIKVNLNSEINKTELETIVKEFNAVYLGTGEWKDKLTINSETFQIDHSSIFAGGKLSNSNSVIMAVSSAKRAAISIDRFIKKVSLTASRQREGAFETPLRYNMEDVEEAKAIEKTSDVYSEEEAIAEAGRCLKCQCNECLKACTHRRKFNVTGKSYAKQIYQNENVIMGTRYANKMINSCAQCGLCKEVCPSGIDMKDIIHETRESMVEKGKMPLSAHDFALKDMEYSNNDRFFMVKPPPKIAPEDMEKRKRELFTYPRITFSKYAQSIYKGDEPGTEKVDFLFYPGCQLSASNSEYVQKTYEYLLDKIKEGTGIMLGCCGAPADWAGEKEIMKENADRIKKEWEKIGKPTFILACSSCYSIFEKYLPEIPIVSLWEIFDKYGLPEHEKPSKKHVINVHDACSTRHNKKVQESVRNIASSLGYDIEELKYTKDRTKCCGYGGLVYYANKEEAEEFVEDRIKESDKDLLVYCAMCKDLFTSKGKRTYHILDLIFGNDSDETALKQMPTLSERHKNRSQLKAKLLKEVWGEETDKISEKKYDFKLIIPEDVKLQMNDRFILMEDVEVVIDNAQKKKEEFLNPEDLSYLAKRRIDNVTYWVRYEIKDDGILIKDVYSHRMEVVEE